MHLQASIESIFLTTSETSTYCTPPQQPHNPYARIPSRRAIACITCAKAKTKCDKALPSCSRCITKGIKCEPRSTRRTSDNSYRANMKKPFVPPKRHHSTNIVPTLNRETSARSIPSSSPQISMRTASHIDFRTAVKMSQQASGISGYPMLTPLPKYAPRLVEDYYLYPSSPEQNTGDYTQAMETNTFSTSGRSTPQTPKSIICHEPISMGDYLDPYMTPQSWPKEMLVSADLGFDSDMTAILPKDTWTAVEAEHMMPIAQMSWSQPSLSVSPQQMPSELVSHTHGVPSLTASESSIEEFNTSGADSEDWLIYQPTATHINMENLAASAPFMHDLNSISGHAPIWEDVFISDPTPY